MDLSSFRLALSDDLANILGKIVEGDARSSCEKRICLESSQLPFGDQDSARRIDAELPQRSPDRTRKSKFARGIQEEKYMLPHRVTLAARPQAQPLQNGQASCREGSAERPLDVKRDRDCGHS